MNLLLLILLTVSFSTELEVDGDLKVTGNIEAGQIESLQQTIIELQAQIVALQSQITMLQNQLGLVADCEGVIGGDAIVDCNGICNGDGGDCTCIDIEGNSYEAVRIGNQIWMAENLKTRTYNDGSAINEWGNDSYQGTVASIEFNSDFDDRYGLLYNGYIVQNSIDPDRQVCPVGWHIPTDSEWRELESYLGMDQESINEFGWRGSSGGTLKEIGTTNWNSPNTDAVDTYGFSAIGTGNIYYATNEHRDRNLFNHMWSSSVGDCTEDCFYIRAFAYDRNSIYRMEDYSDFGFSIRCIQD